jgi:hypothetical protein
MSNSKKFDLPSLPELIRNAGVKRAGEVTLIEKGEVAPACTLGAWSYSTPLANWTQTEDGILLPEAASRLAQLSTQTAKDWRYGARWDVPIMQLIAWAYIHGLNAYRANPEGLVYLGTPQDIARAITGEPGRVQTEHAHQIRMSVERLCSVSLGDLGYIDQPGDIEISQGPLMTLPYRAGDELVIRVGALYKPEEVQKVRDAVNRRRTGRRALKNRTRPGTHLVPVQSTGLLLGSYALEDAKGNPLNVKTWAAQDRLYGLLHSHLADLWHRKPHRRKWVVMSPDDRERMGDSIRIGRDVFSATVRQIARLGILQVKVEKRHDDAKMMFLAPGESDTRLVRFLKKGGERVAKRQARSRKAIAKNKAKGDNS